jgi:putative oxidoreductase
MNFLKNIANWGDTHHPKALDLIRMVLGILLLVKGVVFLNNLPFLREIILRTKAIDQSPEVVTFIIYYVILVHMIGGVFIFLGLLTRLAALIQIPVVFGAVFFVNILISFFNSELWLSVLVLALLMFFVIIGSGPLSLDRYLPNAKSDNYKAPPMV